LGKQVGVVGVPRVFVTVRGKLFGYNRPMNRKCTCLVFLIAVAGCHPPPEGAVCPSPEEEVAEPIPEDEAPADQQKISEEELERARRYLRETRRPRPGR
jgi:hypothetical protein